LRIQEGAAQGVRRGEGDGMQEPVQASPSLPDLAGQPLDVVGIVGVHLQDLGRVRQAASGPLGQAHGLAEAREDDLGALLLSHPGGVEGDALGRQYARDQVPLPLQQHDQRSLRQGASPR
jgi:hypothetical protein